MNFKKVMQRVIAVILCVFLTMTFAFSVFAFDGEVDGPISGTVLKEYIEDANVFYNSMEIPVYSPFNHETLYWLLKWPIADSNFEMSSHEYFAVTTYESGIYYTYYLVPDRNMSLWTTFSFKAILGGDMEFPSYYANLLTASGNNFREVDAGVYSYLQADSFIKSDFWDRLVDSDLYSHGEAMLGYVYCTSRSKEGTLLSISQTYYGQYPDAFKRLPTNKIVQIYYHSAYVEDLSDELSGTVFTDAYTLTQNVNLLVSTSTYSVTAYDNFDTTENLLGFFSDCEIPFTYDSTFGSTTTLKIKIPEVIRGPNCPEDGVCAWSLDNTSYPYYRDVGVLSSERSFLIIPYWTQNGARTGSYEYFIFVFPEGTTSMFYLRYSAGGVAYPDATVSGSECSFQVISKVDYDVYTSKGKIGSFDAETTTYHVDYVYTTSPYIPHLVCSGPIGARGSILTVDTDYVMYPYFSHNSHRKGHSFNLAYIYGQKSAFSMFANSNRLGFYTYISPDISEIVLNGSNSGLGPGSGGTPGTDKDMWDFDTDFDYSGVLEMEWLPYPDFSSVFDVDFADIWLLPERMVVYILDVVEWVAAEFEIFISTYAAPTTKVFKLVGVVFDGIPPFFRFIFIFMIVCALGMKILQYTSSSISAVVDISSSSESKSVGSARGSNAQKEPKNKGGGT